MTIVHAEVHMCRNDIDLKRLIKKFWSTVRYSDNRLLVCNLRNKILSSLFIQIIRSALVALDT